MGRLACIILNVKPFERDLRDAVAVFGGALAFITVYFKLFERDLRDAVAVLDV